MRYATVMLAVGNYWRSVAPTQISLQLPLASPWRLMIIMLTTMGKTPKQTAIRRKAITACPLISAVILLRHRFTPHPPWRLRCHPLSDFKPGRARCALPRHGLISCGYVHPIELLPL